jgi:hypothetical protein
MFSKDFKLPCRHAWAVALKNDMVSTGERTLRFYKTWVNDVYWLDRYMEGYSCNDILITHVYEGKYVVDLLHGDPDRALIGPSLARREKKKGRKKRSRYTSGGEVGRQNGRTKKPKPKSVSSAKEPRDEDVDIHSQPFATIFGDTSSDEPENAAADMVSKEEETGDSEEELTGESAAVQKMKHTS